MPESVAGLCLLVLPMEIRTDCRGVGTDLFRCTARKLTVHRWRSIQTGAGGFDLIEALEVEPAACGPRTGFKPVPTGTGCDLRSQIVTEAAP